MTRLNFLIISGSYIYRTGLRFLLEELDVTGKIFLAVEMEQVMKTQADILFVDTGSGDFPALTEQGDNNGSGPVVVGLITGANGKPETKGMPWQFLLDMSLPKSELLEKVHEIIRESGFEESSPPREGKLSEREKTILRYVALGFTNKEIAEKLFISMHTVITHRKNITRKIGIKTVSGLTVYALLNHLIEMEEIREQTG